MGDTAVFPFFEIRNPTSGYDLGFKLGVIGREKINGKTLSEHAIEFYRRTWQNCFNVSLEEAADFAMKHYFPAIKDHSKILTNEIKGLSDGSGIPLKLLVMMLSEEEIEDQIEGKNPTLHCSNAIVDNLAVHVHDWNYYPTAVIFTRTQNWVGVSVFPELPNIGIRLNPKGKGSYAHIINSLYPLDYRNEGLPRNIIGRAVLEFPEIEAAIHMLEKTERAGGMSHCFLDFNSCDIYNLETTAREIASGDYLTHTNHYKLLPNLDALPSTAERGFLNSLCREKYLNFLMKNRDSSMSPNEFAKSLVTAHTADEKTYRNICQHAWQRDENDVLEASVFAAIMSREEIIIYPGTPCVAAPYAVTRGVGSICNFQK
jgi:hypothetical protein